MKVRDALMLPRPAEVSQRLSARSAHFERCRFGRARLAEMRRACPLQPNTRPNQQASRPALAIAAVDSNMRPAMEQLLSNLSLLLSALARPDGSAVWRLAEAYLHPRAAETRSRPQYRCPIRRCWPWTEDSLGTLEHCSKRAGSKSLIWHAATGQSMP